MPIQKLKTEVIENIQETPSVNIIRIKLPENISFEFKAGQYMMVHLEKDGESISKPYSISSSPFNKEYLETVIKRVPGGFASNFLCDLKVGDELVISGPYGHFVLKEPVANDVIWIATGSGISPFPSMLDVMLRRGVKKKIILIFGVRTQQDIIYRERFEQLAKEHPNFTPIFVLSREPQWNGYKGHVQDDFQKIVKDSKGKDVYICGLQPMVEDMIKICEELGFPKENVHYEKYV